MEQNKENEWSKEPWKPEELCNHLRDLGISHPEARYIQEHLLAGEILEGLAYPYKNSNNYQLRRSFKIVDGVIMQSWKSDPERTSQRCPLSDSLLHIHPLDFTHNEVFCALNNIVCQEKVDELQAKYDEEQKQKKNDRTEVWKKLRQPFVDKLRKALGTDSSVEFNTEWFKSLKKKSKEYKAASKINEEFKVAYQKWLDEHDGMLTGYSDTEHWLICHKQAIENRKQEQINRENFMKTHHKGYFIFTF